ncbi:hypothetical protein [Tomitella cavernea]|nr:hypothetical protein [Tomitella cavernea]
MTVVARAAVVAGARTIAEISEWIADLPRWAWLRLGIGWPVRVRVPGPGG